MILDATAFRREMWYDKNYSEAIYMDKRKGHFENEHYDWSIDIHPDVAAVWSHSPFKNECFDQVLFDPPHKVGNSYSVFQELYGQLGLWTWQREIFEAVKEFHRVLKPKGMLFFKWAETSKASERAIAIIKSAGFKPLFGSRTASGKTSAIWVVYVKEVKKND